MADMKKVYNDLITINLYQRPQEKFRDIFFVISTTTFEDAYVSTFKI